MFNDHPQLWPQYPWFSRYSRIRRSFIRIWCSVRAISWWVELWDSKPLGIWGPCNPVHWRVSPIPGRDHREWLLLEQGVDRGKALTKTLQVALDATSETIGVSMFLHIFPEETMFVCGDLHILWLPIQNIQGAKAHWWSRVSKTPRGAALNLLCLSGKNPHDGMFLT